MPKLVGARILFLHSMISRLSDVITSVMAQMSKKSVAALLIAIFAFTLLHKATAGENRQPSVQSETLLRASSSWDGGPYKSYPAGRPQLAILKVTLAPHTVLEWHTHPIPNAAYLVSGELTLERKEDGKKQRFVAGQAVAETVGLFHRGIAGSEPVVLIVFYAGSPGVPLTKSRLECEPRRQPLKDKSWNHS